MGELNLDELNDLESRIGVYGDLNIDEAMELVVHIRKLTPDRDSWCNQAADRHETVPVVDDLQSAPNDIE